MQEMGDYADAARATYGGEPAHRRGMDSALSYIGAWTHSSDSREVAVECGGRSSPERREVLQFETTVPTKIVRIMCAGMRQSITPIPKESKSRLAILAILEMDLKPGWLLHNVLGKFSRGRSVPFHK